MGPDAAAWTAGLGAEGSEAETGSGAGGDAETGSETGACPGADSGVGVAASP